MGGQTALNLAVMNANNEKIFIINDDNVLCSGWDTAIESNLNKNSVLTLNQIEPTGPGIFHYIESKINPKEFDYFIIIKHEKTISNY